jgi:hypothetical protein
MCKGVGVVGGEVSRRGVREKVEEESVLRKTRVRFETLVLRETIARFKWKEG